MRTLISIRAFVLLTAIVLIAGCTETNTPPLPGPLLVSLTTPAADDGAVMFRITGPGLVSIQPAASGYRLFWRLVSAEEAAVIALGSLASGPVVSVQVADVNQVSRYTATITEVASRDDQIRASTAGYTAAFSRP
jgi:hypothetical protein